MGTKRGNNEGSITKRSDGRWVARLTLSNGKRKDLYAKTRQEAARLLTAAMRDRDAGIPSVGERQTVAEYFSTWLADIQHTIKPRSWIRYEEAVRLHIVPDLGKIVLSRLTPQQLQGLYTKKLAEGQAPGTVARLHAVIRRALGEAQRMDLVQRNVAMLVRAPRPIQKEMRVFSPEQARTFLEVISGDPLEALYTVAMTTGMRRGELLALRWKDVDLEAAFVQIHQTVLHLKGGGYIFTPPKTRKSRRKVALAHVSITALRNHKLRQEEYRLKVGPAWHDEDLVFPDAIGRAQRGNHILERQFTPLLKKAGLPLIRFHDLRHTAATLMLQQGVHPKIVSEMLGHSTVSMTLDTYSHILPDMQKDATAAFDRLLEQ